MSNTDSLNGRGLKVAVVAVSLIIVTISATLRIIHPTFQRPVQLDELITLQNYTWAGVYADGSRREIRQLSELSNLETPSLRRLIIGLYCSVGRWPEPNNHIPHSILTNVSLLLPGSTLQAARWPAVLSCSGFALLCVWLCLRCEIQLAAPMVCFLAMWHPYAVQYSQESRGYALMLTLSVALVMLLQSSAISPRSLVLSGSVVAVACLSFLNLVNLSVDWVVPIMVAAAISPGLALGVRMAGPDLAYYRKSVVVQLLIVGLVGGLFLLDRLPYVYSSASQYGVAVTSWSQFRSYAAEAWRFYSPNAWWGFLTSLGIAGAFISLSKQHTRILSFPWLVAGAVSLLHFMLARKFPYTRNLGVLLPVILFGCGVVFANAIAMFRPFFAKAIFAAVAGAACVFGVMSNTRLDITDVEYVKLSEHLLQGDRNPAAHSILLRGSGVDSTISLYCPNTKSTEQTLRGVSQVSLITIEKSPLPPVRRHALPSQGIVQDWNSRSEETIGPYQILELTGELIAPEQWDGQSAAIAIWYPPFDLVSLSNQKVVAALDEAKLKYSVQHIRYQAKLEVLDRLNCVLIEIRPGHPQYMDRLKDIVASLGGELFIVVAKPSETDSELAAGPLVYD